MPISSSPLRRLIACAAFLAFMLTAVLANPRPAQAISGRTWTIVTLVVVACFVLPMTPCHPLGKVAGATPPERNADCADRAALGSLSLGSVLEEGAPVHMLRPTAVASCASPAVPLPAQSGRAGNEL